MSPEREPETFSPLPGPQPAFPVDEVRDRIQKYFRVYEVETDIRGIPRGEIAAYYVQTDPATFPAKFEDLRTEMRTYDPNLVIILQHKMGEDVLLVARKPELRERGVTLNVVLLLLTILTTTMAGALFYTEYAGAENLLRFGSIDASFLHPRMLAFGFLTFSLPLIVILGVHELGHFFVAKRHHVRTSLPYFIPVPPIVPIGTFGAFISIREPIPDRKALFDIGASGPIAGFLVAIPILVLGMVLTATIGVPVPPDEEVHSELIGPGGEPAWGHGHATPSDEYATGNRTVDKREVYFEEIRLDLRARYGADLVPSGTWTLRVAGFHFTDDHDVRLRLSYVAGSQAPTDADFSFDGANYTAAVDRDLPKDAPRVAYTFRVPSNATELTAGIEWETPPSRFVRLGDSLFFMGLEWVVNYFVPLTEDVLTHPTGLAGWVGLLVTGFNLLPAGQLDGGHVARAVLGDRVKWASYGAVALMFLLSLEFAGWLVMAVLIVLLGVRHPPPLNDKSPLDPRRKVLAFLVFVILIVTFVPFPFLPA